MGFLGSIWRMISTTLGLVEGKTERTTDALVSGSPDAIRNQFRKTREDWTKDYSQMREAVAELIRVREMRTDEVKRLNNESENIDQKMAGAIELFKKNPDPRYREAYGKLATEKEQKESRIKELVGEIEEHQKQIERYKSRLMEFQRQIDALSKEEAETVADIVSSKKIHELNDRLSGLSVDTQSKNLEAIREARQKAKAVAKLSSELSGADKSDFERELANAGAASKHLDAFDSAISGKSKVTAQETPLGALPPGSSHNAGTTSKDAVDAEIEELLSK